MPNFLIGLTLDFFVGIIAGAISAYLALKAKEALEQHKINKILYKENIKLRKEKDELQLVVLQNQIDITFLKENQQENKALALQCLELLGELTAFKDSESLNSTYAATIRFREKFGLKNDQTT